MSGSESAMASVSDMPHTPSAKPSAKPPAKPPAKGGKKGNKKRKAKPNEGSKVTAGGPKKKRRKTRKETYARYIYKVLKQVHPDTGISRKGMAVMDNIMRDLFDRIARQSSNILTKDKKKTLSSREIQTAVKLELPGELSKHAVSEGTKAVTKYTSATKVTAQ